ncbi:type III polyketide synthase [Actinomadura oligospora]|uniref:type III polyketide synthase n=1 Tax=Actinomadura oligospora TaxID=111804 RepID=UPI000687075F|nr:type III polyketide synthase [Actinomadura oligospora]
MALLCKPTVHVPEHVITLDDTLAIARRLHAGHPDLGLVLRLITSTGVRTRHLVQPIGRTLRHPGFEARNRVFTAEAKRRIPAVVASALVHAGLEAEDIDLIVFVSCTGFGMPSLTAWMINTLGFRPQTRQLPIAQLGCAGGGAAINRAHDFCTAHQGANALVLACEFCSLCYQPTDLGVGQLLSNGLFGDAVAAVVVRGDDQATGIRLDGGASYLIPDTEDWISYAVRSTGFHFQLDRRVPRTMEPLAPVLQELAKDHHQDPSGLDFYIIHAGGPRILDDLSRFLGVPAQAFRHSRATLTEHGNIASAVVLDALRRLFDAGGVPDGGSGMIAGFGPGITAEMAMGTWTDRTRPAGRPRLEEPL